MKPPDNSPDTFALWTAVYVNAGSKASAPVPVPGAVQELLVGVQALPDPLGQVIRLRYIEHKAVSAVACALKCSKREVRLCLDKGLHRLRKACNPAYREQLDQIKEATAARRP
jgi:DNA-directed RNA polymerase specialized sigma24 family protein